MPLSEEELRLLEQMERALVQEDPKFASTLRGHAFRATARRKAVLAVVVFVGGVAMLMAGAVLRIPILGVAGFLVMLGSATLGLATLPGRHSESTGPAQPAAEHQSLRQRLEERWHRRHED